eukprot:1161972-Pelagomonas_calceolata.AAC.8
MQHKQRCLYALNTCQERRVEPACLKSTVRAINLAAAATSQGSNLSFCTERHPWTQTTVATRGCGTAAAAKHQGSNPPVKPAQCYP